MATPELNLDDGKSSHSADIKSAKDQSVEIESSSNSSDCFRSESNQSDHHELESYHSDVSRSERNLSDRFGLESNQSDVFRSESNLSDDFMFESYQSDELESDINPSGYCAPENKHSRDLISDNGVDFEGNRTNLRSGIDHSTDLKSESNTSTEFKFDSNYTADFPSNSDYPDECISESEQSVDSKTYFKSRSNHTTDLKSETKCSGILHPGSDNSADFWPGSDHSAYFNSESDHSAEFKPESDHAADFNLGGDHSADFRPEGNHSEGNYWTDFRSETDYSGDFKYESDHSNEFKSGSDNSVDFKSGSNHSADFWSESDHSIDFKFINNLSDAISANDTYSEAWKSSRESTAVFKLYFSGGHGEDNVFLPETKSSERDQLLPNPLPTAGILDGTVCRLKDNTNRTFTPGSDGKWISSKGVNSQHNESNRSIQTDLLPLIPIEKLASGLVLRDGVIPQRATELEMAANISETQLSKEAHMISRSNEENSTIVSVMDEQKDTGRTRYAGQQAGVRKHQTVTLDVFRETNIKSPRPKTRSRSNKLQSRQNLALSNSVSQEATGTVPIPTNQVSKYMERQPFGATKRAVGQCPSQTEMIILPNLGDNIDYSLARPSCMATSAQWPEGSKVENSEQYMGHRSNTDVSTSSSIYPLFDCDSIMTSGSEQGFDDNSVIGQDYSIIENQHSTRTRQTEDEAASNVIIPEASASHSSAFCTPVNSSSGDSLSFFSTSVADEMNDFDSIVPQGVEDFLSLSELCDNGEETHVVTNNCNQEKINTSRYSADELHQTCSSDSVNTFLSTGDVLSDKVCQSFGCVTNKSADDVTADAIYNTDGDAVDYYLVCGDSKHNETTTTIRDAVHRFSSISTSTDDASITAHTKDIYHVGNLHISSQSLSDEGFISHSSFLSSQAEVSFKQQSKELVCGFSYSEGAHNELHTQSMALDQNTVCSSYLGLNGETINYETLCEMPNKFPRISFSGGFNSSLQQPIIKVGDATDIAHELAIIAIESALDELLNEKMDEFCIDGRDQTELQQTSLLANDAGLHNGVKEKNRDIDNWPKRKKSAWMKHIINKFESQSDLNPCTDVECMVLDGNKRQEKSGGIANLIDCEVSNAKYDDCKESHDDISTCECPDQVLEQPLITSVMQCMQPKETLPEKRYAFEKDTVDLSVCQEEESEVSMDTLPVDVIIQPGQRLLPAVDHSVALIDQSNPESLGHNGKSRSQQNIVQPDVGSVQSLESLKSDPSNGQLICNETQVMDDRVNYQNGLKDTFSHQHRRILAFHTPENTELYEVKSQNIFSTFERLMPIVDQLGVIHVADDSVSQPEKTKSKRSCWRRTRESKSNSPRLKSKNVKRSGCEEIYPSSRSARKSSMQYGIYIWSPSNRSSNTVTSPKNKVDCRNVHDDIMEQPCGREEHSFYWNKGAASTLAHHKPREKKTSWRSDTKGSLFRKRSEQNVCSKVHSDSAFVSATSKEIIPLAGKERSTVTTGYHTTTLIPTATRKVDRETVELCQDKSLNVNEFRTETTDELLSSAIADYTKDLITIALSGITENKKVSDTGAKTPDKEKDMMKNVHRVRMREIDCKQDTNSNFASKHKDKTCDYIQPESPTLTPLSEEMICHTASTLTAASMLSAEGEGVADLDKGKFDLETEQMQFNTNASHSDSSTSPGHTSQRAPIFAHAIVLNAYEHQLQKPLVSNGQMQMFSGQNRKQNKQGIHGNNFFVTETEWKRNQSISRKSKSVTSPLENTDSSLSSLLRQISPCQNFGYDPNETYSPKTGINKTHDSRLKSPDELSQNYTTGSSLSVHSLDEDTDSSLTSILPNEFSPKHSGYVTDVSNMYACRRISSELISSRNETETGQLSSSINNFGLSAVSLGHYAKCNENERLTRLSKDTETNKPSLVSKEKDSSKKPLCPFQLVPETESERYRLLIEPQDFPLSSTGSQVPSLANTCIQAAKKLDTEQCYFDKLHTNTTQNRYAYQYYSRRIQCSLCKKH